MHLADLHTQNVSRTEERDLGHTDCILSLIQAKHKLHKPDCAHAHPHVAGDSQCADSRMGARFLALRSAF